MTEPELHTGLHPGRVCAICELPFMGESKCRVGSAAYWAWCHQDCAEADDEARNAILVDPQQPYG